MKYQDTTIYSLILIFSIIVGMVMGVAMIYIGKWKKYILDKQNVKPCKYVNLLDVIWKVLLLVMFFALAFGMPAGVISVFINKGYTMKSMGSLYLCGFFISFLLTMLFLVKRGKIKISTKWPPN
ncbi:MAG: hypothetical protein KJN62_03965 [Deltaproteobacteria bacterium]|nr:hypothetical protein [Deltaproteobacteria bacterium]